MKGKSLTCFVISPIGSKDSSERRWSEDIFHSLIKPVVEEAGYKADRIIDETRPGEITPQIIEAIYTADSLIADLTGRNPNVFYELALRHRSGLPYIHLVDDPAKIPFDVVTLNAIEIRHNTFAGVDKTRKELAAQVRAVKEGTASFENSISRYEQKKRVAERGTPQERAMLELTETVDQLRKQVALLEATAITAPTTMDRYFTFSPSTLHPGPSGITFPAVSTSQSTPGSLIFLGGTPAQQGTIVVGGDPRPVDPASPISTPVQTAQGPNRQASFTEARVPPKKKE